MIRGLQMKEFNESFQGVGHVSREKFHGGKARHIKDYVTTHLKEVRPESVILQIGSNDIPTPRNNPVPVVDIAKTIIQTGLMCREYGAKNIFIGGVMPRRQQYTFNRCMDLNNILKNECLLHGFIFINNSNILPEHLYFDGIHLNNEGSDVLARNYLFYLNSVAWDKIISGQSS